jgi:hypothetical protein
VDEFRTGTEAAFRRNAADYFLRIPLNGPAGSVTRPDAIWGDLDDSPAGGEDVGSAGSRLSRRVTILEEAARHDPSLARELFVRTASASLNPVEEIACRLGRAAGAAAHVLAAGSLAARERGYYSSSLMDFREVQERLAGLVSGAELARFGACRLCRLLDKGETARASLESGALSARAAALEAEVRSVAGSLLGPSWVDARLPADEAPTANERTS